ncbi:Uncharacterised protein [Paucimonas lemoignei]|nr:Uncharacterised protein [Paucimonas lemoignei]
MISDRPFEAWRLRSLIQLLFEYLWEQACLRRLPFRLNSFVWFTTAFASKVERHPGRSHKF